MPPPSLVAVPWFFFLADPSLNEPLAQNKSASFLKPALPIARFWGLVTDIVTTQNDILDSWHNPNNTWIPSIVLPPAEMGNVNDVVCNIVRMSVVNDDGQNRGYQVYAPNVLMRGARCWFQAKKITFHFTPDEQQLLETYYRQKKLKPEDRILLKTILNDTKSTAYQILQHSNTAVVWIQAWEKSGEPTKDLCQLSSPIDTPAEPAKLLATSKDPCYTFARYVLLLVILEKYARIDYKLFLASASHTGEPYKEVHGNILHHPIDALSKTGTQFLFGEDRPIKQRDYAI